MKKLFFIEGLPGTGKTTIAEWLKNELNKKGEVATCLLEDDAQIPTNFCNMASMSQDEYQKLLCSFGGIDYISIKADDYYFISINTAPVLLKKELSTFNIGDEYNTMFTVDSYIQQTLPYIKLNFQKLCSTEGVVIIDSGFLQNPINEILFRKGTCEQVKQYIFDIIKILKQYDFLCIYLNRGDEEVSIDYARKVKGELWFERVMKNFNNCGLINHFQKRYILEKEILRSNVFPYLDCPVTDNDWSSIKQLIVSTII